jgi:PAS domain-containing protein
VALNRIHDAASIVCLGSFNPSIFQPAWLSARGLIQTTEEQGAEIQVITADVTSFKIKWLQLQVLRDRLTAAADTADDSLLLRDLIVGTFKLLGHTPIKFFGLNRAMHFQLKTIEEWHHIGHVLAPKKLWRKYFKQPGLSTLIIKETIPDGSPSEINFSINPSPTRAHTVETAVNHHFALKGDTTADAAADVISAQWEKVMGEASSMAETLLSEALKATVDGE